MTTLETPTGADQYEYLFPDHWLLPEESIWTIMHHAYVGRVIELVSEKRPCNVIEIGCGDGWNCGKAAEAGLSVVGVDWSRNGIEHARRMVSCGRFYCADIRDESFLEKHRSSYDAAMFVEVLEHIPPEDCVSALQIIRALLRPGGCLVMTTPSVNYPNNNPKHYRHFSIDMLSDLFDQVDGLAVETIEGYGDVVAERRYYRLARWVDNRYWVVKPLRRWLQKLYKPYTLGADSNRCHGFILRAIAE